MTPAAPRPDVAGFLGYMAETGAPPLSALSVEAARMLMRANVELADLPPVPLARIDDLVVPGPAGPLPARLYDRRATRTASPLILFFHGGGFAIGDLATHHPFCTWFADAMDLPLLAVDYRLAPEHPFPAAPDDAEAAARWAAQSPPELGFAVTGLIPSGDSAGGNLAIVTAQQLGQRPAAVPVLAQWVFYPFVGGGSDWPSVARFGTGHFITAEDMAWFERQVRAPGDDPRYHCLWGRPPSAPLLMLAASHDVLRDTGHAYANRVAAAAMPVQRIEAAGMIHGFINLRRALPSAQADCEAFAAAARTMLAAGTTS